MNQADAFNYLAVLLSIIIRLGMTQVLTATGRLIRHRAMVRFYWPPVLWAALLLLRRRGRDRAVHRRLVRQVTVTEATSVTQAESPRCPV